VDSAFISDCDLYHVVLFLCIIAHLEMGHSHVFGVKSFKIRKRCQFWPVLGSSRVFFLCEQIFTWTGLEWMEVVSYILKVFSPIPHAFTDAPHGFSLRIFKGATFGPF